MSTTTVQPHQRHGRMSEWSLHHPVVATVAATIAAVVAGALVGILFSTLFPDAPIAQQHRAGGHHARVAAVHRAATAATHTVVGATTGAKRSSARGGFGTGRTAGADDGFFSIAGTRAPARGGFPERSLGAGHVPGGALARSTASR